MARKERERERERERENQQKKGTHTKKKTRWQTPRSAEMYQWKQTSKDPIKLQMDVMDCTAAGTLDDDSEAGCENSERGARDVQLQ